MKKLLTLITLMAFVTITKAQDYKFGKVSKEELQEKVHPIDSSANAAVLFKDEKVSFLFTQNQGFMQQREVHERIKIYNKEGYEWATHKINLYKGSSGASSEKLLNLKGHTFNLKGSKVEKDKLKNDGIFEEKLNDFVEINTLTMPNIQDGCVIEYTYKISSPYLEIDDVYFQKRIPINELRVKVSTPQYFNYNKKSNLKAFFSPNFKESKEARSVNMATNTRKLHLGVNQNAFQTSKSEYFDNVVKISESNIPAIKSEAFAGSMDNYLSKMSFELAAILDDNGIPEKTFASSWEKVSKSIYDRDDFGKQLELTKFYRDDISSILQDITEPFEKAFLLQNYVKSKVKWNGYYGYSTYRGVKKAYNEGEGNVGDVNLLLTAMLRSQGVNANPVLVSTKNNGIPLYPTRKGFNYVICMVENQGQYVLIDATEPYGFLNVLPERALNWQGRLIKRDGSSNWVSLMPNKQSLESTSLNIKLEDDLSFTGKVRQMITSNLALRYKKRYVGMSQDDQTKMLEKNKGAIEISETKMDAKDNGAFSISYNYRLNDAIDDIGGKLYFNPLLFMAEKENPFKLDVRQYPIDFTMPFKDKFKVNIMLPKGYKVEALPKSEVMEFKEGAVKYTFIAKQNGSYVQLSTELDLKSPIIDSSDYSVFKEFYGKVVEKQAEQIVLSKI
ncbi:DUF3857 domain-containing protein [Winogradskyella haliclonae]|uniref:Transglutaminase-like domain-containing protein n=1 Tax=Winogradskyella haliclonae TaxID=2048558 RepID=A0ABQ2BVJ4_9FLAO|nr:transglutaminase domain-containing protein [Winogradskyella haliclonae]GGI55777.1 hypothetical protein GCM10011444_00860 [Winogradskyella haliclonae]